jgi:hypothetical protein
MGSKIILIFTTLLLFSIPIYGQSDEESIQNVIESLFDGMRAKNIDQLAAVFADDAMMQTIALGDNGPQVNPGSVSDFMKRISTTPADTQLDEQILSFEIKVDGPMASAWTPYEFYVNGTFSHCGVNSFQLVKFTEGWKVVYIIDTRRKDPCNQ